MKRVETTAALELLKALTATKSISREEGNAAALIRQFFTEKNVPFQQKTHNTWVTNAHFQPGLPTVLLNSHIDTVKPNEGWIRDPFQPSMEGNTLYGLGSNDAGGSLVALIAAFLHFYQRKNLPFNLLLAATAEEEISGKNGIAAILPEIGDIAVAIVGEPTEMTLAVAEKGLMVLDCTAFGESGHAARDEGENAIYRAMKDIHWFRNYQFQRVSKFLGMIKMSVTMIDAGYQHNVVPDRCKYVVDVRTTDAYRNEDVLRIIQRHVKSEVRARSTRLQPSGIDSDHPVVLAATELGLKTFGSPTLSDQALISVPSVKIGPGKSERSHRPDEFITLSEIEEGIDIYIQLLEALQKGLPHETLAKK